MTSTLVSGTGSPLASVRSSYHDFWNLEDEEHNLQMCPAQQALGIHSPVFMPQKPVTRWLL